MKLQFLNNKNKNILISSFGSFLCMFFIAYINSLDSSNIWLIPPFGASLVLVMAVQDSPLAQPRNVFFWSYFFSIIRCDNVLLSWSISSVNFIRNGPCNLDYDDNKNNSSTSWCKSSHSDLGSKNF